MESQSQMNSSEKTNSKVHRTENIPEDVGDLISLANTQPLISSCSSIYTHLNSSESYSVVSDFRPDTSICAPTNELSNSGFDSSHRNRNFPAKGQMSPPAVLSAVQKDLSELSILSCVYIEIFAPEQPVTDSQVMDELETVKCTLYVEGIYFENHDLGKAQHSSSNELKTCVRIYFDTPERADWCALRLNTPGRKWRWPQVSTKRIFAYSNKDNSGNFPENNNPPEFIKSEVFVFTLLTHNGGAFMLLTPHDFYSTAFMSNSFLKRGNASCWNPLFILCPYFDSLIPGSCPKEHLCRYAHLREEAALKILHSFSRFSLNFPFRYLLTEYGDEISHSQLPPCFTRRYRDTLVLYDFADDAKTLHYMFEKCPGYKQCQRTLTYDGKECIGLVLFDSYENALGSLSETYDSGLNIHFWGVLWDLHNTILSEEKEFYANENSSKSLSILTTKESEEISSDVPLLSNGIRKRDRDEKMSDTTEETSSFNQNISTSSTETSISDTKINFSASDSDDNSSQQSLSKEIPEEKNKQNRLDGSEESSKIPFPPLPPEWQYGYSRRTNHYFFFQPRTKTTTTWKHPITNERYSL